MLSDVDVLSSSRDGKRKSQHDHLGSQLRNVDPEKAIVCLCLFAALQKIRRVPLAFCFAPHRFTTPLNLSSATMGILAVVAAPLERFAASSSTVTLVFAAITSFLVLAVVINVLNQVLLRNPHEPPMVFHLFPIIGSTIGYGIDPYKFFFACREKV